MCKEEALRPFDLSKDLMLRAKLFRLGQADHVLFLNVHHIASDGWSMGVMFAELKTLYATFLAGEASPLPELAIQYADYAAWQRQWLQGEVLENRLNYWLKQVEGAPERLELPTDRPRPDVQSFRGAMMFEELPGPIGDGFAGDEPGRRHDLVHDLAGGVRDPAAPLYRAGGNDGWICRRGARPDGGGKPDRIFCQRGGLAGVTCRVTRLFGNCLSGHER